jgi:[acyl-carrier-protein] S-malonyltransferase
MNQALLFPGQGSQSVGMGRALAEASTVARETFGQADDILGFSLSRLCWEGPEDQLQLTENTQPAILTMSVAVHRHLVENRSGDPNDHSNRTPGAGEVVAVAGHSLGEYSALVAASSLSFEDALRLVRRRGQAMQRAVPVGVGAMAAVLGLDEAVLQEIVEQASAATSKVCALANLNAPGQIVIAGHREAVEAAVEIASGRGAKRSLMLPVSAPFHSPLMAPAREVMAPLLEATAFSDPEVPVITNVDAAPAETAAAVRDALIRQIDSPVRWIESVRVLIDRFEVDRFLELGPGAVLGGLVKRIERGKKTVSLGDPADFDKLDAEPGQQAE